MLFARVPKKAKSPTEQRFYKKQKREKRAARLIKYLEQGANIQIQEDIFPKEILEYYK
jgi:hypothetical protein